MGDLNRKVYEDYADTFRRLGLTQGEGDEEVFRCPACGRWNDVSINWINLLVDCSCGWGGDVFSVVMAALDVDAQAAIRILNLRHSQRTVGEG